MKLDRSDVVRLGLISLLSATPIGFVTFDFMFPNVSTPSLAKNLMLIFALSVLAGMPAGYFQKRTDLAMMSVILYTAVGYIMAVVLYSAPYTLYNIENILPSFYYAMFFRFTIILLFLYVFGGFVGSILGQLIRDSIRREETKLEFESKPETKA
jgi:hypothetical protein